MIKKFIYTISLLLLAISFVPTQSSIKVDALTARSIDITNASEATIRNYYASLNSKSTNERQGDALLTSLKPILKAGHVSFSYTTVWDWTKITDRDWNLSPLNSSELSNYSFNDNPYVKLLYRNDNGTATAAQHADTHGKVIDREHVWPKSLGDFGENAPAGTDLHHLILADSKNNQVGHNSQPYGNVNPDNYTPIDSYDNVDNPTNVGNYTGKRGDITYGGKTYIVYEPQDSDKGDIARAMFYMAARYSSYSSPSDPYLKLSNTPNLTTTASSETVPGQNGFLDTLLQWHTLDPVDDYEIRRNNLIYNNAQFNRNPFIDYPSWVDSVWGSKIPVNPATDTVTQFGVQSSVNPTAISLSPSSLSLGVSDTSILTVNVTPLNGIKSVTWSSSNPSVASVSNGVVTAQSAGNATITATSTLDGNVKGTASITVTEAHVKSLSSITLTGVTSTIKYGDTYPIGNIVVTAHYDDATTANVTSSAIIASPNMTKIGPQNLVVHYSENAITKYASFNVQVTNNGVVVGNIPIIANDIFISEYIEGSSNNKAIELYNGTGASINLSGYFLKQYNAGGTTTTFTLALSGTINNNDTYVIANSASNSSILAVANMTTSSSTMAYNGNDAIELLKGSTRIDLFGIEGDSSDYTINTTFVRKSSVHQPRPLWDVNEWTTYPQDTVTYLGSHTMTATTPGLSAQTQADAWASYFLDATSTYCEDETGYNLVGAVWTDLANEYAFMDSSTKAIFFSTTSNPNGIGVAGAKARYYFLITKYQDLKSTNFMRDGSNNPIYSLSNHLVGYSSNSNTEIFIVLGLSVASILSFYFFSKKKKALN